MTASATRMGSGAAPTASESTSGAAPAVPAWIPGGTFTLGVQDGVLLVDEDCRLLGEAARPAVARLREVPSGARRDRRGDPAAEVPDYTYWELRPQPRLGTVEVRVIDAQPSLESAGPAALVQGLGAGWTRRPRTSTEGMPVLLADLVAPTTDMHDWRRACTPTI